MSRITRKKPFESNKIKNLSLSKKFKKTKTVSEIFYTLKNFFLLNLKFLFMKTFLNLIILKNSEILIVEETCLLYLRHALKKSANCLSNLRF